VFFFGFADDFDEILDAVNDGIVRLAVLVFVVKFFNVFTKNGLKFIRRHICIRLFF